MVELILTGALVVCVIGLGAVATRIRRGGETVGELLVITAGLAVMIWAPSSVRSVLVGGFVVFATIGNGTGVVLVMLAIVIATALWLPGGVSVLLFVILAGVGVAQVRAARRHLIRISRAGALIANQPVDDDVELTGTAHPVFPLVDPVYGAPCALWRVEGEGTRESSTLVEVRGASGSALVDPTTVRLEWSRPAKLVQGDEATRAAELLRLELVDGRLQLQILADGDACYVMGKPTWEIAPAPSVGLYRDSLLLPTFRSDALFSDRSEAQLRSDHTWAIASWAIWGALCAAIAVLQLGGWS